MMNYRKQKRKIKNQCSVYTQNITGHSINKIVKRRETFEELKLWGTKSC